MAQTQITLDTIKLGEILINRETNSTDKELITPIKIGKKKVTFTITGPLTNKAELVKIDIAKVNKFLKPLGRLTDKETRNNATSDKIKIGIIDLKDILFTKIPVIENKSGVKSFYLFAGDAEKEQLLVGENKKDTNPKWVNIKTIIDLIDPNWLETKSTMIDKKDLKKIEDDALSFFKQL